ncbi:MAG: metallophosphoesterase, partial [Flavisolibacter sp.]|nr:metallophosphoesterase [Flavisolibacter sp.]
MFRFCFIVWACFSFVPGWSQADMAIVSVKEAMVQRPASTKYSNPSFLRKILLGKNYRKEWSTPVSLPVFHLAGSGLVIKELGGGKQTKSLRLEDKKGKEWVLRTVDKDVSKALPKGLRGSRAHDVVQDMVSAAYPYAPLTIPTLAKAVNVPAANPVFYFVPDDPAFGQYRQLFANQLCMLEEREPVPPGVETESTEKVVKELTEENENLIRQRRVLAARLLDMLLGDWDRHADQWRWGEVSAGRFTYFYAIPRDRDQAYFYSNGLLVKLARQFGYPHFIGFNNNTKNLKRLNYKGWNFDMTFLNGLNAMDWETGITSFQKALNDKVIETAVKKLPPEIYAISGKTIEEKLKNRRDGLLKDGMIYYRQLAYHVRISGSDEAEIFRISQQGNKLVVAVFDDEKNKNFKVYERTFTAGETQKITLFGLGGKDTFVISENVTIPIKLYLRGGKGKDVYQIKGKQPVKILD